MLSHQRRLAFVLSTLFSCFCFAETAHADPGVIGGVRLAYFANAGAAAVGGELLFKIAPSVYFNPNVEVVFKSDSYLTFNLDFHYDFPTHGDTLLWAGAGLAFVSINPPGPEGAIPTRLSTCCSASASGTVRWSRTSRRS